jgi:hypothetical protein
MATNRFLPDDDVELSDEQLLNLTEAKRFIPKLKAQLQRAKQAGIDVASQEDALRVLEIQVNKLNTVYGRKTSSPK